MCFARCPPTHTHTSVHASRVSHTNLLPGCRCCLVIFAAGALNDAGKQAYKDMEAKDKHRHAKEMEAYNDKVRLHQQQNPRADLGDGGTSDSDTSSSRQQANHDCTRRKRGHSQGHGGQGRSGRGRGGRGRGRGAERGRTLSSTLKARKRRRASSKDDGGSSDEIGNTLATERDNNRTARTRAGGGSNEDDGEVHEYTYARSQHACSLGVLTHVSVYMHKP